MVSFNSCEKENNHNVDSEPKLKTLFTENYSWQTTSFYLFMDGIDYNLYKTDTTTFSFSGDTMFLTFGLDDKMQLKNYKKIIAENVFRIDTGRETKYSFGKGGKIEYLLGFLRVDSTGKVYYINKGSSKESLLYDFSYKIGQVVPFDPHRAVSQTFVDTIDYVEVFNTRLKRLKLKNSCCMHGDIIEGIGSSTGMLKYGFTIVHYTEELIYIEKDGIRLYASELKLP